MRSLGPRVRVRDGTWADADETGGKYEGGVRGFRMTITTTATVQGTGPFSYSWYMSCDGYGTLGGPDTEQCTDTYSYFCAAPGTSPCTYYPYAYARIANNTLAGLDYAEAEDNLVSISCRYAA